MKSGASLKLLFAAGWLIAASAATAEIVKWVDENGVVNYGESAPPGRKAQVVSPDKPTFSVVPSDPAIADRAKKSEEDALKRRVDRLEDDLAREREQRAALDRDQAERQRRLREYCAEQRVPDEDCSADPYGVPSGAVVSWPPYYGYGPPPYRPNVRPPAHRPKQKPQPKPVLERTPETPLPATGGHPATVGRSR
jgi:hypothetical protein